MRTRPSKSAWPALLALLAIGCGSAADRWMAETGGRCGPMPEREVVRGRYVESGACVATEEVERDCASRPAEERATLTHGDFGGGAPPPPCREEEQRFLRERGWWPPCRCMTEEEIASERMRP